MNIKLLGNRSANEGFTGQNCACPYSIYWRMYFPTFVQESRKLTYQLISKVHPGHGTIKN